MRLSKARVRNYRSIRDTGCFDVESEKTILVGPNEGGKTALLKALQQVNPPDDVPGFDPLRDYPRSDLDSLKIDDGDDGSVGPSDVTVVEAKFTLEEEDKAAVAAIDERFAGCTYVVERRLDNDVRHRVEGGPFEQTYSEIREDLTRLAERIDARASGDEGEPAEDPPSRGLEEIVAGWADGTSVSSGNEGLALRNGLEQVSPLVDKQDEEERNRLERLFAAVNVVEHRESILEELRSRLPVFVYFSNYFRVRPRLHLGHLAGRLDHKNLDDDQFDRGNVALLKLLGFTAQQLSDLGRAREPNENDVAARRQYEDQLDKRRYRLNAASIRLTNHIRDIWQPDPTKSEANQLRVEADQQYLKVVVEDSLGVEVELDQRSEGFQWLVSFFVVFFAEAADSHKNAILLLDEPGLSLHGLKQREFRTTLSRLAENNQLLYTTHSPFLVGPDELDRVRVVEMTDRAKGTIVHTTITAGDSAALLPLQEALGYDLAQSLFLGERNLVLEGFTDFWYLEATAALLRDGGGVALDDKIVLMWARTAGKVVYFATILHANKLKVAALLDSDSAGDQAAKLDTLVHTLGNTNILRTKDAYTGQVSRPEVEDLLRDTLIKVARDEFGWDVASVAKEQPTRPIVDVFGEKIGREFSKYHLAKAYVRWTRDHDSGGLTDTERRQWRTLIEKINAALA